MNFNFLGNLCISGTLKAIQILRNGVITPFLNAFDQENIESEIFDSEMYEHSPINLDKLEQNFDASMLFDPFSPIFVELGTKKFEKLLKRKMTLIKSIEYRIIQGQDFVIIMQKSPKKKSMRRSNLNTSICNRAMTLDSLVKDDADKFSESLMKTFNKHASSLPTRRTRLMKNIRNENSISIILNNLSLQNYTILDEFKSKNPEEKTKFVIGDMVIKDKIQKSEYRYLMKKTKFDNYLPFTLELKRQLIHQADGSLKPSGYDISVYVPETTLYLTDESTKFIKSMKEFKHWTGLTNEILVSIFGEMEGLKVNSLSANQTDLKMKSKSKGLFTKPTKEYVIRLPAIDVKDPRKLKIRKMTHLLDILLYTRYQQGNPYFNIESLIEEIPVASDINKFVKNVKAHLSDAESVENGLDLNLAYNVFKDLQNGLLGFTECSVTSFVRWANLGGAGIDEENISHNLRELFSKVREV
jgi:hypothetical protein